MNKTSSKISCFSISQWRFAWGNLDAWHSLHGFPLDKSVRFDRRLLKTSHELIGLLSQRYRTSSDHCKCPKILSVSGRDTSLLWQIEYSLKTTKRGNAEESCLREITLRMPSNLQRVCEVTLRSLEAWWLFTSALSPRTHIQKQVCL